MVFALHRLPWTLPFVLGLCPFQARSQDQTFNRALALYQRGELPQARSLLTAAIHAHPFALDLSLLGTIEVQQGDLPKGEAHLRRALVLEPGLQGTRLTLASVLESEGKTAEAQETLTSILATDHRNLGALLALARLRNRDGKTEEALAFSLRAKAIAPRDPSVLYAVGALCLQMDLIKDGTENLEQAAALDPSAQILYALASARVANRDFSEANKIYDSLLRADPSDAQLNYALGTTYFLNGENEAAKTYFERSIQLQPDQAESIYYLGLIADQQGDKKRGEEMLNTVISRQPKHARAHLALGQLYRSQGRLEEARQELEIAIRLTPESQKAHYQFGLLLAAMKEQDGARRELDMAKQLRTSSDDRVSWRLLPRP